MPVVKLRVLALLVVGACAGASTSPPAATPTPAAPPAAPPPAQTGRAMQVPGQVAGFTMVNRRNFDDPRAGSVFRYNGPDSLYADVFLYPGPDLVRSCDTACASRVMRDEVGQFEHGDLPEMVRRGNMETASVVSREGLVGPSSAAWRLGAHLQVSQARAGRSERSDFYLYYAPGVRVKVRATFVETSARLQAIEAFVRDLLPALLGPRT